jgi:hypothetical protein
MALTWNAITSHILKYKLPYKYVNNFLQVFYGLKNGLLIYTRNCLMQVFIPLGFLNFRPMVGGVIEF